MHTIQKWVCKECGKGILCKVEIHSYHSDTPQNEVFKDKRCVCEKSLICKESPIPLWKKDTQ